MVATWPGAINASKAGVSESSNMATAGQVSRPLISSNKFSGIPSASIAATGAQVVSKPATKNTTVFSGLAVAILTASVGDAMGLMSAPAALACSKVRIAALGTLTGTRNISPKASNTTSSWIAICMAW